MRVAVLVVGVFFFSSVLGWTQDVAFPTLAGGTIRIEELVQGRWALGFVVIPGCPACEKLIGWFSRAAQAFPEVRFLFVAPKPTPELAVLIQDQAQVLLDRQGLLSRQFEIKRAPTVVLLVEGVPAIRLDWPFSEEDVRRELGRSFEIKALSDLLGKPAPDFRALSLSGEPVAFSDLPRPLLLMVFNPGCPPCWEVLPALAEISSEMRVGVLAFVGETGLSPTDRTRLEVSIAEKPIMVLIVHDPEVLWTYGVMRSPSFIVVDGKGVVSWVWSGLIRNNDLAVAVRAALSRATSDVSGK